MKPAFFFWLKHLTSYEMNGQHVFELLVRSVRVCVRRSLLQRFNWSLVLHLVLASDLKPRLTIITVKEEDDEDEEEESSRFTHSVDL